MSAETQVQILPLRECPQAIAVLAARLWKQWGHLDPQDSVERRCDRLRRQMESDELPQTWVAIAPGGEPAGSASLVPCDLESRKDLTPWMASVLVDEKHRGHGIGSLLVKHVMSEASRRGWEKIYLFTWDQQKLYTGLGWREIGSETVAGSPVSIMEAGVI